jgi:NAD(P)-dependent dehydrogenase (short-subunit alcohol dehydrogenase family)
MGACCITKAGIALLVSVRAGDLGGYGIRVFTIVPGRVTTDLSWGDEGDSDSRTRREEAVPLGGLAEMSDLVWAALFFRLTR